MDKNTILVYQIGSNMARMSPKWWTFVPSDTTTERELLSIVEALKEFRNILLGQQIIVHTDHKNLTHGTFTCDRVMRWRLFIEEYSPDIRFIEGNNNVVADAL